MNSNACCIPRPCERCGACPCCGRGPGYYQAPYFPSPYPQPIWTVGGYVPSTTTGILPTGVTVYQSSY